MDLVSWTFSGNVPADRPILMDPENDKNFLTYHQLESAVKQVIAGLHHEGIKTGDCVLVNAFNGIFYHVLYLGVVGSGAIFTGVNPGHTTAELEHHMRLTKPKLIIVEAEMHERTLEAAKSVGLTSGQMILFDHANSTSKPQPGTWTKLLTHGWRDSVTIPDPPTTILQYASTSGTSGLPKAALIPHAYHVTQAAFLAGLTTPYPIRRLTALPPFHAFATPIVPASVHSGVPVWVMKRFDAERFCAAVARFRISETYMAPNAMALVLRTAGCRAENLESLRQIWFGGAACAMAVRVELYRFLHEEARIQPVWGMTEAGWISASVWPERCDDDTVGRLIHGFHIKVVDEKGEVVTEGSKGELVVQSPTPMLGYVENEAANKEVFDANGWIRTGDVGYVKGGKVFVIDRKKDIIKVRSWQVSPTEVEAVLLQHPAIDDAAVIGVRDKSELGDVAKAFVVLARRAKLTEQDVKTFAGRKLAKYKVPQVVEFVSVIPKNPTGKILRHVLREQKVHG